MKKLIPFILIALTVISCKKVQDDKEPIKTSNCPIKVISSNYSGDEFKQYFTYSNGKIIKTEYKENGVTVEIVTYLYSPTKITKTATDDRGDNDVYEYFLNSNGLIVSSTHKNTTFTGKYEYDADGKLIKTNVKIGSTVIEYTIQYKDGNPTMVNSGYRISEYNYNKLEDYANLIALDSPLRDAMEEFSDDVIISEGYFGKLPKNLCLGTSTNAFSYIKDTNGNIVTIKANDESVNILRSCN